MTQNPRQSVIRERSHEAKVAYAQGYLAGLNAMEAKPGNYLLYRDHIEATLRDLQTNMTNDWERFLADNSRWAAFGEAELSELYLSLDHRLAEAERGNAYVWWDAVGDLLIDLVRTYPGVATAPENPSESPADEVQRRLDALHAQWA